MTTPTSLPISLIVIKVGSLSIPASTNQRIAWLLDGGNNIDPDNILLEIDKFLDEDVWPLVEMITHSCNESQMTINNQCMHKSIIQMIQSLPFQYGRGYARSPLEGSAYFFNR